MELRKRLSPERCAFVIIDIQNDFCHSEGFFSRIGNNVTHLRKVIEPIQRVEAKARQVGIPVIYIRTEHDSNNNSEVWLERTEWARPGLVCQTGSWGAEFYEIKPKPGDIVITKYRYSAFAQTHLELVLRSLGRDSLLFAGLTTSVCVESSVRDGLMKEFHVATLEDGCAEISQSQHEATLKVLQNYFGPVVNSEQVITCW